MATLSLNQMALIAATAGLPGDPWLWAAVGMAESTGRTDVVNSIGCVGIWQINQPVHVKANPTWTVGWLKNPVNNALAAKKIYNSQGMNAWEAYTNGAYKKHYKNGGVVKVTDKPVDKRTCEDYFAPGSPGMELCLEEGESPQDIPTPGEALNAIPDALKKTADFLVNPRTWLRVAYGVGGGILVLGGLFLLAEKSAGITAAGRMGKAIRSGTKAVSKGASS